MTPWSVAQQKESFAAQIARLQTIPGVGPIVASTAIAVFSKVERLDATTPPPSHL
jgi:hypothetical protein